MQPITPFNPTSNITSNNQTPFITPIQADTQKVDEAFVVANYAQLEPLTRRRKKELRLQGVTTCLNYSSKDVNEERERVGRTTRVLDAAFWKNGRASHGKHTPTTSCPSERNKRKKKNVIVKGSLGMKKDDMGEMEEMFSEQESWRPCINSACDQVEFKRISLAGFTAALDVLITGASQSRQHDKSESRQRLDGMCDLAGEEVWTGQRGVGGLGVLIASSITTIAVGSLTSSFAVADLPILELFDRALPLEVSLVVDGFLEDFESLVLLLFFFLP
nr:hypothetical protein [Tanacetum cinerariifolium]